MNGEGAPDTAATHRPSPRLVAVVAVVVLCTCALTACRDQSERVTATTTPTATSTAGEERSPDDAASSTTTTTASSQCQPVTQPLAAGEGSLTVNGVQRPYLLALPDDLDPTRPTPVILDFHGSSSNMAQQAAYSRLPAEGTARGYVVVTPQGTGEPRGWDLRGGNDSILVDLLLARLSSGMCIDQNRVDAAGISNGSAFAALLACRPPYRIAAIGMVAATLGDSCPTEVTPAAIAFHGTDDPLVPFGGGAVRADGARGLAVGAAEPAFAEWAAHNGCSSEPLEEPLGNDVVARTWQDCAHGPVAFYRIEGGGHTWPGPIDVRSLGITQLGSTSGTIDATALILDLFDRAERTWDDSGAPATEG